MNSTSIVVLVITHNNVDEIDKTWESIQAQNYPKENIWTCFVDFDSTDGTYEKILSYDRYHTAVFQIPDAYDERVRESYAVSLVNTQPIPGALQHLVSLRPGDVLYESCFSVCADTLGRYRGRGYTRMVCEADIMDQAGAVASQASITEREILLDPLENSDLLLEEFHCHYVGYLGGAISTNHNGYYGNERCFWNKTPYGISLGMKFIYSPKTLLCLKERNYRDEVAELLSRWERVTALQRSIREQAGTSLTINMDRVNRNLANYSMWRLGKRYPELTQKEREDLLYLAEIINPAVEELEIYKELSEKVRQRSDIRYEDYRTYFDGEFERGRERVREAIDRGAVETGVGGI